MISAAQVRMAKAALRWSNTDLANAAGVHKNTVSRAEAGTATRATMALIQQTFEKAGIQFDTTSDRACVCMGR